MPPTPERAAPDAPPRPRPDEIPAGPRLLATFFGSGLLRPAPGTWTSALAALPLLAVPDAAYAPVVAALAVLSYVLCVRLASHPRLRPVLDRDPGWFTLDEACGVWIAAWRPAGVDLRSLLVAVVLFRVFDVLKPPPIGHVQSVGRGHGIVLDDVLAGLVAIALGLVVDRVAFGG